MKMLPKNYGKVTTVNVWTLRPISYGAPLRGGKNLDLVHYYQNVMKSEKTLLRKIDEPLDFWSK